MRVTSLSNISNEKICCRCHLPFPATTEYFYKHTKHKDGLSSACIACTKTYNKDKYHIRDKLNTQIMDRRHTRGLNWYRKNRSRSSLKNRRNHRAQRLACFAHYGTECACCGETHIEFLGIDHINGGGHKHRKEIGQK